MNDFDQEFRYFHFSGMQSNIMAHSFDQHNFFRTKSIVKRNSVVAPLPSLIAEAVYVPFWKKFVFGKRSNLEDLA